MAMQARHERKKACEEQGHQKKLKRVLNSNDQ